MTLRPADDLRPASWFVETEADWWTKICLGPPGHEAYVRLQLAPADEESDVDLGGPTSEALHRVLPRHTATPEDCFFAMWEGCGWDPPVPPAGPTFPNRPVGPGDIAERRYHLFTGTLDDLHAWDGGDPPHLTWPADRAFFVAKDVDPDWVAVGGTRTLARELEACPGVDAAPSAYDALDWESR